ncbi:MULTISPECIES: 50S ribosomal protein L2 [Nannocystis]|uniref:Large ribosomal subunit protein uL2 n=1 Tax=Nannocystis pusilla TaxID=889268 RepID=A0ABS7TSL4_9BACT|nr:MULTISPECIES: 50S ribosomal protein L2 [Nannocystis]MBZ5711222.1 50S ribosomal protein L2 [Nannocystis pusilla]MCY1056114.1 50S ribosomal protein L2 [Nannocystis sp. SCPEA4]
MGIKVYRPTSPGRRGMSVNTRDQVTASEPHRPLVEKIDRHTGRNNYGRKTSRFRGGGHKQLYRVIDFKRDKFGVPGKVATVEYDPNRTTFIALINYADGEKRYILAPEGLKVGDSVISDQAADIKPGNSLPLRNIPVGTIIHNLEIKIGKGGQLVRTAGSGAQLMAREGDWTQVRLPSGEVRRVHIDCRATVGTLSNGDHSRVSLGKAGRTRWLGIRPHNRGVTMNPVDHPMGGGEGRTSGGRHPCSPWGILSKGYRTRHNKRTDVFIVSRRKK